MSGMKRLTEPPRLWEVLATATATILTIVVAAVSVTWAYGRSMSDTELRISEVELYASTLPSSQLPGPVPTPPSLAGSPRSARADAH